MHGIGRVPVLVHHVDRVGHFTVRDGGPFLFPCAFDTPLVFLFRMAPAGLVRIGTL